MRKACTIVLASLLAGSAQGAARAAQDTPAPAAAPQDRTPGYARVGRFIYAFHRAGVSLEQLTDPVLARRGPPELARRAGALAERFDQIVSKQAAVSDEEIQATLREAQAVGAAIAQWRDGPAA